MDMKGNTIILTVMTILVSGTLYLSYTNSRQIQALRQENTYLWLKMDSLQQTPHNRQEDETAVKEPSTQNTGNPFIDFLIKLGEDYGTDEKIVITSKYSLEDRYVLHKVIVPEISGEQTGKVVLNISVDYSGRVKSAKLKSATGITDEDVIEACKKAALKTSFNYDSDKTKQTGTITYIFSENQ